jgi:hypothetical protein
MAEFFAWEVQAVALAYMRAEIPGAAIRLHVSIFNPDRIAGNRKFTIGTEQRLG